MVTVFSGLLAAFRGFLTAIDNSLVRGWVAGIDWNMPLRTPGPRQLACLGHLDRISAIAGAGAGGPLASFLAQNREDLCWGQTYSETDFGEDFLDNYGWLEVFGTRGHYVNAEVAAGVLILGPGIVYPDHHHVAEEIYIPLTGGTEWRMGEGGFRVREAGEVVHHASSMNHAMRTGTEPLLAAYLWRGGPLAAKSTIAAGVNRERA